MLNLYKLLREKLGREITEQEMQQVREAVKKDTVVKVDGRQLYGIIEKQKDLNPEFSNVLNEYCGEINNKPKKKRF